MHTFSGCHTSWFGVMYELVSVVRGHTFWDHTKNKPSLQHSLNVHRPWLFLNPVPGWLVISAILSTHNTIEAQEGLACGSVWMYIFVNPVTTLALCPLSSSAKYIGQDGATHRLPLGHRVHNTRLCIIKSGGPHARLSQTRDHFKFFPTKSIHTATCKIGSQKRPRLRRRHHRRDGD